MKELIQELALLWPEYLSNKTEDRNERAYQLIYDDLPKVLKFWNKGKDYLTEKSSGGTGNVTAGPWFATFDKRITEQPQKGYYLVYLFSVDMKKIVLELGFATKQFKDFYGDSRDGRQVMRQSAVRMQDSVQKTLESSLDNKFIQKLNKGESDLSTFGNNKYKLQIGYEKASIFNISYNIDKLNDEELKDDYLRFIQLYQEIVVSRDSLDMDTLFDASISIDSITKSMKLPKARPFVLRAPPSSERTVYGASKKRSDSPAESTKKIGDLGESIVMSYEYRKLIDAGLPQLAEQIVHEEAENKRPGWDISSFDESGKPIQIEVKASKAKGVKRVIITENELNAAKLYGDSYHIYLVSGLSGNKPPEIEVIKNPAEALTKENFQLKPVSYDLKLYPGK
ncbi:DUF3578 domain-containing protein [Vibrio alginolyticus]|uniref:MrcB family domain-containing protein n=1 Tax=Vibrio alginolyticus TaxID=663 RepID=UPI00215FCC0A|nr:DUF3578 domain-containing protein [Vibrio alginolyticus]MCS0187468.1 DUF3578 domain-containing protein [Vibrio alginolyticus]